MTRFFLEVCYKGTCYAGFQKQKNANSVQAEVEKAMKIFFRKKIELTGSSRTDAGVHAIQNYFHFDFDEGISPDVKYNLNSILPPDIAVLNLHPVLPESHCRFDALSREYAYNIYASKNPFMVDRAYYYPYLVDVGVLNEAARHLYSYQDFSSFSKRRTQVKTKICTIMKSEWKLTQEGYVYEVKANRFLRGMVRGLVGTMLQVGRQKMAMSDFVRIIDSKDSSQADFSVPAHGLWLLNVAYPENYF